MASLPDQSLSDIPTDALHTGHHHPYDPLRPKRKKPAPTGAPKQRRKSLESHSGALVITWREDTNADGEGETTGKADGEAGGAGSAEIEGGAAATGMEESTGAEASMLAEVVVDEALAIREPRPGSADAIAQVVSGGWCPIRDVQVRLIDAHDLFRNVIKYTYSNTLARSHPRPRTNTTDV